MKTCPKCNTILSDSSRFCNKCGCPLEAPVSDNSQDVEPLLQAAYYFREGENVEKNVALAIALYKQALIKSPNNVRALSGLASCYRDDNDPEKNKEIWFPLVEKAANDGHTDSQVTLALYYSLLAGDSTSIKDYERSIYWYEKAAGRKNTAAMWELAWIYLTCKDSTLEQKQTALSLLHSGYELKPDEFAEGLGDAYYFPNEGIQDYGKAFHYLKEAAIGGSGMAAFRLGQAYEYGHGVEIDIYQAISWYQYGADLGDEDAIFTLSAIYEYPQSKNRNIKRVDPGMTLKILEKASESSAANCHALMKAYELGSYGKIDRKKADYLCNKYTTVLEKCGEDVDPAAARDHLHSMRQLRLLNYAQAVALWVTTSDSDTTQKKDILRKFEQNIDECADTFSLKTLACILLGYNNMHRFDLNIKERYIVEGVDDPLINSNPAFIDIKHAFDLLDKGVSMGDEECGRMINAYCRKFAQA